MKRKKTFVAFVVVMLTFCSAAVWMPSDWRFTPAMVAMFFWAGMGISMGLYYAEKRAK